MTIMARSVTARSPVIGRIAESLQLIYKPNAEREVREK